MPYQIFRLPRAMSTGFEMRNGELYATMPRAFLGALSRLTMTAFSGSRGSTSMYAVPFSRS